MNNIFSFERFVSAVPQIMSCLGVTVEFFVVCSIGVTIFGVVIGVLRIQNIPVLKQLLAVYVSYMRGTPLLVQMLVVYYGLPLLVDTLFGIDINRWDALIFAEIALIMNESAFFGEVVRGAILSIPPVQVEAGYSIGMTRFQTFMRITLPQTIRIILPSYCTTLMSTFQSTSLLYLVGVTDMMARASSIKAATGHSLEAYAVIAIIYIIVNMVGRLLFHIAESRSTYGRRQTNVV